MPKQRSSKTHVDHAIDNRLEQLAVLRFGQPRATEDIRYEYIFSNPIQHFSLVEAARELAVIISEQGSAPTLWVRPHPDKRRRFQLLYGPQWHLGASLAGYQSLPCVVVEANDTILDEFGIVEAMQRMSFPLLREAEILRWLLDDRGYTIRSLAALLGKKKGYLENRLALLQLPDDLQALVAERPETLSAVLQLAKVNDVQLRVALTVGVCDGLLTVEAIRSEVKALRPKQVKHRHTNKSTMPASSGVATCPPSDATLNTEIAVESGDTIPGETSIKRILMRWKALQQDKTMRPTVETALARVQEMLATMAEPR